MDAGKIGGALLALSTALGMNGAVAGETTARHPDVERGRYLVIVGSCNDCYTPNYPETAGQVPEREWLTGSPVGFQGPWGTTYPTNLRLAVQGMSEEAWMVRARSAMRPPMPWFTLRDMAEQDLRAIYRYIRSLGPRGTPAPAYAPPGQPVPAPYFKLVLPENPASQAEASR